MIRTPVAWWMALVGALSLALSDARAAGRWIVHVPTHPPTPSPAVKPIDMLAAPDTAGHWVWVVWYDAASGTWGYDPARPYVFSNGTVPFVPPQYGRWYYVLLYDVASGLFL